MERKPYPSDLTDDEWKILKPFIPDHQGAGRPHTVNIQEILNTIFYRVDNGIKWRAIPHDLPSWSTIYDYYRRWVRTGLWKKINAHLVKLVRRSEGRDEEPSLANVVLPNQEINGQGIGTSRNLK
ncbi:transposase [Pannus brasiliensis CCIBt3594]|uniref:Transposase n=1 Tax=Pannus brasiliensis CCIBt3594 TaxID=1427578 RepID=A0AAW9QU41_9CHRO